MTNFGGNSGEYLRQYIDSIEHLQEEKAAIAGHITEKFAEAKANGFDTKAMRKILAERKLSKQERETQEAVLDQYRHALGMVQTSFEFEPAKERGRQTDLEEYTGASAA